MSDLPSQLQRGLQLRAAGRLAEALALFDAAARGFPAVALPLHLRGVTLCNLDRFEEGIADLRAAVALEPRNADVHCDLGFMLYLRQDLAGARGMLDRALMLKPGHAEALANLSLVRREQGDFAGSEKAARLALAGRPELHAARINLAYSLLAQGRFAEGWRAHAFTPDPRANLRDPQLPLLAAHIAQLPAAPAPIIVHGEQGLGDTLFFLRFAPELKRRGYRLAFWGDPRLRAVLEPAGLFEHFLGADAMPAEGFAVAWAGDLPYLLQADQPEAFPSALPLAASEERTASVAAWMRSFGPRPYIGVTWRAGTSRAGRIALSKSVPVELLGSALQGIAGTFVSLQRAPQAGELDQLAASLGAPVHDLAAANEDLAQALACMQQLDEYVGVSNTNTHLSASAGKASRVLVPWPAEWRWAQAGESSPWYREARIYRQDERRDWSGALSRLREDLQRPRLS